MRHDALEVEFRVLDSSGLELFRPLPNFQGFGHGNLRLAGRGIRGIVDLPEQPRGQAH